MLNKAERKKPKNSRKEKLVTERTLKWFQTKNYQQVKHWSQSIHYNGSKPFKTSCIPLKFSKRSFVKTTFAYENKDINKKK